MNNPKQNPNCCGNVCTSSDSEVRVYPLGGGANLILCLTCWVHENMYRHERALMSIAFQILTRQTPNYKEAFEKWPMQNWDEAEIYGKGESNESQDKAEKAE